MGGTLGTFFCHTAHESWGFTPTAVKTCQGNWNRIGGKGCDRGKGLGELTTYDMVGEEICQDIRIMVVKSTKIEMKCGTCNHTFFKLDIISIIVIFLVNKKKWEL